MVTPSNPPKPPSWLFPVLWVVLVSVALLGVWRLRADRAALLEGAFDATSQSAEVSSDEAAYRLLLLYEAALQRFHADGRAQRLDPATVRAVEALGQVMTRTGAPTGVPLALVLADVRWMGGQTAWNDGDSGGTN